jgi:diguanylate cyclase (GGDEF)-like protein
MPGNLPRLLIACRNLLIYMNNDLQDQIIKGFHFALNADGSLFLGPSEGIGRESHLFRMQDKKHKIFRRLGGGTTVSSGGAVSRVVGVRASTQPRSMGVEPSLPVDDWLDKGAQGVLSRYFPAYVVVDANQNIWRISTSAAGRYVEPATGRKPLRLSAILAKPLRTVVQAALKKSKLGGEPQLRTGAVLDLGGQKRSVTVTVDPFARGKDGETFYVVAFQDDGAEGDVRPDGQSRTLLRELETTRAQLSATIADVETANEDLKSINEEQQSLNEELQSSLEELETSKEELQSINEELQTVNAELLSKNEMLSRLNSDFRNLLDSTQIATVFLDQNLVVKNFTPGMSVLFNLREIDAGRPITEIAARVDYPDLRGDVAAVLQTLSMIEREVSVADTGAIFLMRMRPYRTIDDMVDGVVLTFIDITDRKHAEDRVHFLAEHDGLTGLPNRTLLDVFMVRALAQSTAIGRQIAVLYLDLDRFKAVNDVLGHQIGDKVLQMVGKRLSDITRGVDLVARLGGDEFGIVLVEMTGEGEIATAAGRIIEVVGVPYEVDGHQARVGASIGIALAPQQGANPDLLLRNADVALYRAKTEGRDTFRFFEPAMEFGRRARQAVENDLRHAIARDQLVLFFQPMVGLPDHQVQGFEALLRWNHPRHGLLNASDFIPVAEETGAILAIGDWVLQQACAAAMAWPRQIRLAVNLSPRQFDKHALVRSVEHSLRATGIEPGRLELEITETVLLNDDIGTRSALGQLRELGVRISIDDFGTGYSSLSHLRSFSIDKIKVDQGFVRTLEEGGESSVIIKALLALAEGLKIEACAEGVETEAQLARLQALGCRQVQGWLLGRPMAEAKVREFLVRAS